MNHNFKDIEKRIDRLERILDAEKVGSDNLWQRVKEIEAAQSDLADEIAKVAADLKEVKYRTAWVEFQMGLV